MPKQDILLPLPDKDSPDYFRTLVSNCIRAYEKLSNDSLALDYCRISDKKLRAMILGDEEYKAETRNIYARQRLEEMDEVEHLASLADGGDNEEDYYEPRDGKKAAIHKDVIAMRFKAAQMKRELRAELSKSEASTEMDAVNLFFVDTSVEEFMKLEAFELNEGSGDEDLDSLIGTKEAVPTGTLRIKGKTKASFEKVLENGEIIEED